ncbi:unnamed protein product, partial [Meganyctiphanes norvegica]
MEQQDVNPIAPPPHNKYKPFLKRLVKKFRVIGLSDGIRCPLCNVYCQHTQNLKIHLKIFHINFLQFRALMEGIIDDGDDEKEIIAMKYTYLDIIHKDFVLDKNLVDRFKNHSTVDLQNLIKQEIDESSVSENTNCNKEAKILDHTYTIEKESCAFLPFTKNMNCTTSNVTQVKRKVKSHTHAVK